MTSLLFSKYQASGNDFIILNAFVHQAIIADLTKQQIQAWSKRRFGIGADGLIVLSPHDDHAFTMHYYNADGALGTFCGNGSRAALRFASDEGIIDKTKSCSFFASDGVHKGCFVSERLRVSMQSVQEIQHLGEDIYFLNTGSPHYVRFVNHLDSMDIVQEGKRICYDKRFAEGGGTNVNFVERLGKHKIKIRTYERGVENETLSCGTGMTAASLVAYENLPEGKHTVLVEAKGGAVEVDYEMKNNGVFIHIFQTGDAKKVFSGQLTVDF